MKLIKGKHESGRSHVTLFLTFGFYYHAIIEEFDKQCGLPLFEKLVSCIYTMSYSEDIEEAINFKSDSPMSTKSYTSQLKEAVSALRDPPPNEVIVFLLRQKMKHTCNALRQYLAGHTVLYAEHLRRVKDHQGVGMSPQIYTNHKVGLFYQLLKDW